MTTPATGYVSFPHQLPIELALGMTSVPEICAGFGLSKEDFAAICEMEQFMAMYDWALEEKKRPGGVFRLQMAMMADEAAKVIFLAMTDKEAGIPLRMRAAELVAKFGGLEPPKAKEGDAATERFAININLTHPVAQPALPATPATITIENHS